MKSTHWETPSGYVCSAYCTSCGRDFSGDKLFDRHRIGKHEYTYSEGLNSIPPLEDGRRCMTTDEMLEAGMRPMTETEMNETARHRHRIGFNVEMWFDPTIAEDVKNRLRPE